MATNDYQNRVVVDPKVMLGKPLIKGTRITIELILRQLAQGIPTEDILENYPHLVRKDVLAAIAYANKLVEEESVYPLGAKTHGKAKAIAG